MPRKGTHIKALILLVVFSLNTVVSFACSLGGFFHSLHHQGSSSVQKNLHGHHEHGHQQKHENAQHHHDNKTPETPADDCCTKNIVVVEKVEKSVSRAIQAPDVIFLATFLTSYNSLFSLFPPEEKTIYPDHLRRRLPSTIQDLRIVIQSFQI